MLLALLPLARPVAAEETEGSAAGSVLALLRYQHGRCDRIADSIDALWLDLGSEDPEASQRVVRERVLHDHAGDLAEARAAGAEARRLLSGLRREDATPTATTLSRLWDLGTSLCDLVALPTAPRSRFAERSTELRRKIEAEDRALGRTLAVDEGDLQRLLLPFLPRLQIAGVRAEGELSEHRRSEAPPPPAPRDPAASLESWAADYARVVGPAKGMFGRYVDARKRADGGAIVEACRELTGELPRVLRHLEADPAPEPGIARALVAAWEKLRELALHCVAGRQRETEQAYEEFRESLARAAALLAPRGLRP